MAEVVAFVPNLMDRSKFPATVTFISSAEELSTHNPRIVVVDLDRCDNIGSFVIDGAELIGFGPHVESSLADQAVEAGYTNVLPRSVFFKRCKSLLG